MFIFTAMQQSQTMAITQDQREMQDHPTLPAMPGTFDTLSLCVHIYLDALENFFAITFDIFLDNYRISGETSSSTMTDHLQKDFNSSGNQ